MKIIKSKKYANTFEGYDPYSVDFTKEEELAKNKSTSELLYALKDAIEASQVSPNAGKYTDQASVYRRELENRGIPFPKQDRLVSQMPSLHTNSQAVVRKKAQLDILECVICGKSKDRDQMANKEVCLDCDDKEKSERS